MPQVNPYNDLRHNCQNHDKRFSTQWFNVAVSHGANHYLIRWHRGDQRCSSRPDPGQHWAKHRIGYEDIAFSPCGTDA